MRRAEPAVRGRREETAALWGQSGGFWAGLRRLGAPTESKHTWVRDSVIERFYDPLRESGVFVYERRQVGCAEFGRILKCRLRLLIQRGSLQRESWWNAQSAALYSAGC